MLIIFLNQCEVLVRLNSLENFITWFEKHEAGKLLLKCRP